MSATAERPWAVWRIDGVPRPFIVCTHRDRPLAALIAATMEREETSRRGSLGIAPPEGAPPHFYALRPRDGRTSPGRGPQ